MKLIVTDAAHEWFKREFGFNNGGGIKFYGKVYGSTEVHHGFSQGFARDDHPIDPVMEVVKEGVNYHVNDIDEWFFSGLITTVDYNPKTDGPVFHFQHEDGDNTPEVAGLKKDSDDHADNKADASTGASQRYEEYWE